MITVIAASIGIVSGIIIAIIIACLVESRIKKHEKERFNEAVQKRMDEVKERLQQLQLRGWQPKERMQNKPPVTPPTKGSSAEPPKRIIIIFERTDELDEKDSDKGN